MRQVFLEKPWIYNKEPSEFAEIFVRYGRLERYKRGATLAHGGKNGRIYYLSEGLVSCSSVDRNGQSFTFCLIPPERVFSEIDGISRTIVNVYVTAIRPSTVYSLDFETWFKHLGSHQEDALTLQVMQNLIGKFESHMEAMIANYTLPLSERLRVFLKVLLTAYTDTISEWNEIPIYLSAQEYAELMGASRVSISRLTSKWQKEMLLRKEGRSIFVRAALFDSIYDWVESNSR
ncbi:MAG: Crp/Fnr family transcriptional regulator [Burkholderiales bacterium]|jgi:CRP-like cAMP-binding protein|nr:Crp/Fnr family transcriptional regulator [Burkholderiales bacterium]